MNCGRRHRFAGTTVPSPSSSSSSPAFLLVSSLGYASALAVVMRYSLPSGPRPRCSATVGTGIHSVRLSAFLRPSPKDLDGRVLGRLGVRADEAAAVGDPRRPCAPDPAHRPVPVAEPRPGGHRRHAEVDHRAPGLRPDGAGLRLGYNGPLLVAVSWEPAKQSSEYTSQYQQATSLQKQLEQEQKQGKSQQQQLQAQADSLNAAERAS